MLLSLGAFVIAGAAAVLVTPASGRIAQRFGILDHPGGAPTSYKKHTVATPYLGGIAIVGGTLAGSLLLWLVPGSFEYVSKGFPAAIVIAILLGVVGLRDDIRSLPRSFRLLAQVGAAVAAWAGGFGVQMTPWMVVNIAVTILWVVGITNAFNLLDNMDGLTAGLASVSALSFAALGLLGAQPLVPIVAAALAGSALGFLAHNRHPAKIFMGDAGSLFLGFLLALLGLRLRFDNLVQVTFLIPVIVLGIPILDTTLVVWSRIKHGRPVFLGGRDHISHRLVRIGLSVRAAVGILYFAAACLGWIGIVISQATPKIGFMLLGFVFAVGAFFGLLLLQVPVYEEDEGGSESDQESVRREGVAYLTAVDNTSENVGS